MSHFAPYGGKAALVTHESSHDSFDTDKHFNWLSNNAGIGIYAHGRIHQQVGREILVGDLIHKRGHGNTDDLLLMEEQALLSTGDPLTVPSRMGTLTAMAVLPTMSTGNGEGSLIAYYQNGVVSFDTFEVPRESRYDGDGKQLTKGWDSKRLVNHLLNVVSAVGHRAVSVLTRDHFFRSRRGLHFLKTVMGEGTFNSENINTVSSDVSPILDADPVDLLEGSATGFWIFGNRLFATVGLSHNCTISSLPYGKGFVVWNQATTFTEDRTPRPAWEGLWRPDGSIEGIHHFVETGEIAEAGSYGFVCSDVDGGVRYALVDEDLDHDVRDGQSIPVQWSFETARFAPEGLNSITTLQDCLFEGVVETPSNGISILLRTDVTPEWTLWKHITPAANQKSVGRFLFSESVGKPSSSIKEATWFQLRIEGSGYTEIRLVELDYSPSLGKSGRQRGKTVLPETEDFFRDNQ